MKTLLKFILLATLIVSCNNDDTVEIQTCEMTDLGITEAYKNPHPEHPDTDIYNYADWKWTLKEEENILVLSYEVHNIGIHGEFEKQFYYFSYNDQMCIELTKRGVYHSSNITEIDENGLEVYPLYYMFEIDPELITTQIQLFELYNKLVGKVVQNNDQETIFYVTLNANNHVELNNIELNMGF